MTNGTTYTVKFASAVKSDVRKLDKQLKRIIKEEHLANIERDPFGAITLLYEFKGLWSYHFNYWELNIESYMKSILKLKLR